MMTVRNPNDSGGDDTSDDADDDDDDDDREPCKSGRNRGDGSCTSCAVFHNLGFINDNDDVFSDDGDDDDENYT